MCAYIYVNVLDIHFILVKALPRVQYGKLYPTEAILQRNEVCCIVVITV